MFVRLLILIPTLYAVAIVLAAQKHDDAASTLRAAVRIAIKSLAFTVGLVVLMQVLQFLFID